MVALLQIDKLTNKPCMEKMIYILELPSVIEACELLKAVVCIVVDPVAAFASIKLFSINNIVTI